MEIIDGAEMVKAMKTVMLMKLNLKEFGSIDMKNNVKNYEETIE